MGKRDQDCGTGNARSEDGAGSLWGEIDYGIEPGPNRARSAGVGSTVATSSKEVNLCRKCGLTDRLPISGACRSCSKKRKSYREKPENKKKQAAWMRQRLYGVPAEQQSEMLARQCNLCACCGDTFKSSRVTHLDHNHATGLARAFICGDCNRGIGAFRDSAHRLRMAIEYLTKHAVIDRHTYMSGILIDAARSRQLAVEAGVDPKTIIKVASGVTVRGMAGQRAINALVMAGILKPDASR